MDLLVDVKELKKEAEELLEHQQSTKNEVTPEKPSEPKKEVSEVTSTNVETSVKEGKTEIEYHEVTQSRSNTSNLSDSEDNSDFEDSEILEAHTIPSSADWDSPDQIQMRKQMVYLKLQKKVKDSIKLLIAKQESVETDFHKLKLTGSLSKKSSLDSNATIMALQQRVIAELQSTQESTKVILQFTDSIFTEKSENVKLVSKLIRLLHLVLPICQNCLQRCNTLLEVDSTDIASRFNLVDNKMVEWILENPTFSEIVQKSYDVMNENKGIWFMLISCMSVGVGYLSKQAFQRKSVGIMASVGAALAALSLYFLGKEVSMRQNPRLIHQLRQMRELVENTDDEKTLETLTELVKTMKVSQKASFTYTKYIEMATMECPICLEPLHTASIGSPNTCNHMFHFKELEKLGKKECPTCRASFDYVKQIALKN